MASHNKKRKAEDRGLDEMDRQVYSAFRTAANSISMLYTSSVNSQKRAFNSGARHTIDKLLAWANQRHESGEDSISTLDFVNALQAELVVLEGEDACLAASGATVAPPVGGPWGVPGLDARGGGAVGSGLPPTAGAKRGQAFSMPLPQTSWRSGPSVGPEVAPPQPVGQESPQATSSMDAEGSGFGGYDPLGGHSA